jgi:hypothetical protein
MRKREFKVAEDAILEQLREAPIVMKTGQFRELLLQVATGEISMEDAQRELDIGKAQFEMMGIALDMGLWSCPPEERMQRESMLIAKWPEACRRAGVGAIPMPDHMMRVITSFVRRAS